MNAGDPADPRDRVTETVEALSRINLQVVVLSPPDATRRRAQATARQAAASAGRSRLLDEAVSAARETVMRAFSRGGFSGTWAATDWSISVASAADRVAAAAAFEEAAMAAVVEDLVDEETVDILRSSAGELGRTSTLPVPGSLSTLVEPRRPSPTAAASVGIGTVLVVLAVALWFSLAAGFGLLILALVALVAGRNRLTGSR
jgi:hypothetical protein